MEGVQQYYVNGATTKMLRCVVIKKKKKRYVEQKGGGVVTDVAPYWPGVASLCILNSLSAVEKVEWKTVGRGHPPSVTHDCQIVLLHITTLLSMYTKTKKNKTHMPVEILSHQCHPDVKG